MSDAQGGFSRITVEELKGLNEREQDANLDVGEFDVLKGFVPTRQNTLTKINGARLFHQLDGEEIIGFCQTNNSRRQIYVQTRIRLYAVSEDEFFNRAIFNPALNYVTTDEEESMARAVLIHSVASGSNGGTYTTLNIWQKAPLSSILTQLNADGSPAAFCTLLADEFTLSSGVYRLRGWSMMSQAVVGTKVQARIYNVTAATPAWIGQGNEYSNKTTISTANKQVQLNLAGDLNLGGNTTFRIEGFMSAAQVNTGFGTAQAIGTELYRWLEIIKTTP